jgi:Putative flagellar system-associated repeat
MGNLIPFNTSINLTGVDNFYPTKTVNGPLTFTPGSTLINGCNLVVYLIGNGINIPVFSSMLLLPGANGFDRRNGALNKINFIMIGSQIYYTCTQPAGFLGIQVPILLGLNIDTESPNKIGLLYDRYLNLISPVSPAKFTITASGGAVTVSGVAVVDESVVLTLSRNITSGETVTATYNSSGSDFIKSLSGGVAAKFTNQSVTNGTASTVVQIPLTVNASLTATLNGNYYDYLNTVGFGGRGISIKTLPANTDGELRGNITNWYTGADNVQDSQMGLQDANDNTLSVNYCRYMIMPNTKNSFNITEYNQSNIAVPSREAKKGNWMRIKRAGTTVAVDFSKTNGATWINLKTYINQTGATVGALYARVCGAQASSGVNQLRGIGFV